MKAIAQSVKEKPILFSGPMINAILEGRKTQTRRVVNPQPIIDNGLIEGGTSFEYGVHVGERRRNHLIWTGKRGCHTTFDQGLKWMAERSPYGGVADRLWVRETFGLSDERIQNQRENIVYRADSGPIHEATTKWKPSIFMPRWASRITLEIVSVRVERLQEINEEDAIAEGIELVGSVGGTYKLYPELEGVTNCAKDSFSTLWDSINGKKLPWSKNPWVWVIEFKRYE